MEPDAFGRLLADTRQKEALSRVEYLISRLRELGDPKTSPKEYRDFHSFLRSEIHKAERVQAEATRMLKRARRGRGSATASERELELDQKVCDRIVRRLRTSSCEPVP